MATVNGEEKRRVSVGSNVETIVEFPNGFQNLDISVLPISGSVSTVIYKEASQGDSFTLSDMTDDTALELNERIVSHRFYKQGKYFAVHFFSNQPYKIQWFVKS